MKKLIIVPIVLLLAACSLQKSNSNLNQSKEQVKASSGVITQVNTGKNLDSNKQQMSEVVKKGDKVAVDYIGFFPDGKVFDTSLEDEAKKAGIYNSARVYKPLEFVVGAGQMIPCFDKAVEGMKPGEEKEITCQPEEAYGPCDPKKYQKVPKSQLQAFVKAGYKLEKGEELPTQYGPLKIVDVDKDTVTLDLNNPMCGKILKFKIYLRKIVK